MKRQHVAIERMTRKQIGDTTSVLTRAFYDNPMAQAAFRGAAKDRLPRVRRIYRAMVEAGHRFGTVYVVRRGGRIVAAMVAYPSGSYPLPATGNLLSNLSSVSVGLRASIRYVLYNRVIAKLHPTHEHWYLHVLGVGPGHQGRGYGQALLRHFMRLADSDNLPGYLETDREDLVGFYQHNGFVQTGESTVAGMADFKVWCLQREPGLVVAQDSFDHSDACNDAVADEPVTDVPPKRAAGMMLTL